MGKLFHPRSLQFSGNGTTVETMADAMKIFCHLTNDSVFLFLLSVQMQAISFAFHQTLKQQQEVAR